MRITFLTILVLVAINNLFGSNIISLPYISADIVYSPKHDKLYAIINAMDTEYGNRLIEININTGEVERALFVGSQPGQIRLTSDEDYVWISFYAIPYIKRVDLNSFVIDKKVYLGPSIQNSSYQRNSQILCYNFTIFENENNTLALGLKTAFIFDEEGIVLYKNDTIKTNRIPETSTLPVCFEPVDNNSFLIGHKQTSGSSDFTTMKVVHDGLETVNTFEGLIETNGPLRNNWIKIHNDTVYVAEGIIIDATEITDLKVLGTCENDVIGDWYGFTFSEIHNAFLYPNMIGDSLYLTFYDKNSFEAYGSVFLMEYPYYHVVLVARLVVIDQYRFAISIGKDYGTFSIHIFDVFGAGTNKPFAHDQFKIYPNPATDKICISGDLQQQTISIFDMSGRLINTWISQEKQSEIDVSNLNKGIYILNVAGMDNIPFTKKIIIQ